MTEHTITCANHPESDVEVKHLTVEGVRQCHLNPESFTCTWLYERTDLIGDEEYGWEPYTRIVECGAVAWPTQRGWTCEAGHEHVTAEVRMTEGWDYASDPGEAEQLRRYGVDAVSMRGDSI